MQRKCFQVAIYAPLEIAAQNPCWISLFHCEVAKRKYCPALNDIQSTLAIQSISRV